MKHVVHKAQELKDSRTQFCTKGLLKPVFIWCERRRKIARKSVESKRTRPRLITKSWNVPIWSERRTSSHSSGWDGFTSVSHLRAFSYTPFISSCSTSFTQTAMKSLLRKKNPADDIKRPSPPSSNAQYTRQPPMIETPLYARFASTKSVAQPLEKTRLVVSGPMPLGRPSRANLEADSRRKHEDENPSRGRLSSNGRRVFSDPESQLDAHEFQPSLDAPIIDLRPPNKVRTACKSHFSAPIARRCSPLPRHAILDDMHSSRTSERTSEHLRMAAARLVWL